MIEMLYCITFDGSIFKEGDIVIITTKTERLYGSTTTKTFQGRIVDFAKSAVKQGRRIKLDTSTLYNSNHEYIHFDDIENILLIGEQV